MLEDPHSKFHALLLQAGSGCGPVHTAQDDLQHKTAWYHVFLLSCLGIMVRLYSNCVQED